MYKAKVSSRNATRRNRRLRLNVAKRIISNASKKFSGKVGAATSTADGGSYNIRDNTTRVPDDFTLDTIDGIDYFSGEISEDISADANSMRHIDHEQFNIITSNIDSHISDVNSCSETELTDSYTCSEDNAVRNQSLDSSQCRTSEFSDESVNQDNLAEQHSLSDATSTDYASDSEVSEENSTQGKISDSEYSMPYDIDEAETSVVDTSQANLLSSCEFNDQNYFSLALLSLVTKHKITDSCTSDILKLFSHALSTSSTQSPLPSTLFLLLNNFLVYSNETITHRCCGACGILLQEGSECDSVSCVAAGISNATFIEVCLDKQLQTLFSGNYSNMTKYTYICNKCSSYYNS